MGMRMGMEMGDGDGDGADSNSDGDGDVRECHYLKLFTCRCMLITLLAHQTKIIIY